MFELISAALIKFHFIRPEYLLALALAPLLWLLLNQQLKRKNNWSQLIDPRLLAFLQHDQQAQQHTKRRAVLPCLFAMLLIFAAAGPTWEQKPSEVYESPDSLVLILDLSLSMLASDTAPSRLVRAKQKLQDLLGLRKQGYTALVAFSGDSHIVTPLTDDVRTISANLAALEPMMMPVIGSRPDAAVDQAIELIKGSQAGKGRIILLTDGVAPHQVNRINDSLQGSNIVLNILAAGTSEGGPIDIPGRGYLKDKGSVVIPKTDFSQLAALAEEHSGQMYAMALDDRDLNALDVDGALSPSDVPITKDADGSQNDESSDLESRSYDQWEDMAYLLTLIALPLCLLAYRQGALLLLCLMILNPQESMAFEWNDLWQTSDQQAQHLMDQEQYDAAAIRFKSTEHAAQALYRSGQYAQAKELYGELYGEDNDLQSLYNQANSMAKAGELQEALKAYDEVLEQNPADEDAAFNRAIIEKLLEQAEQQSSDSDQNQSESDSESSDGEQDQKQEQSSEQGDKQDGQQGEQQEQSDSQNSNQEGEQDGEQQSQEGQSEQEPQQSQEQSGGEGEEQDSESSSSDIQDLKSEHEKSQEVSEAENSPENSDKNSDEQKDTEEQDKASAEQQAQLSELGEQDEELNDGSMAIENSLSPEEQQSYEQWMRRVPDDPSGLLKRKFEQQARERNRQNNTSGEPLW